MLSFCKPSTAARQSFLAQQATAAFSYPDVGVTAGGPATRYLVDHTRICLGTGVSMFESARSALWKWKQFELGWVDVWPIAGPPEPGQLVSILGRAAGLWWLNACRVICTFDESQPSRDRCGFAYGTLPHHLAQGEERFTVEWRRDTDQVLFEILACSRPNQWWTRLGYPLLRRCQKRFGREAAHCMFDAVSTAACPRPPVHQSAIWLGVSSSDGGGGCRQGDG